MGLRDHVTDTYCGELYVPFTLQEYRNRVAKVKKRMAEENIDLLYCTAPVSMYYLTGYMAEWYQGEEPLDWLPVGGIALSLNSDKILFFDRSGHEPLTTAHILGDDIDVRIHSYKIQEETGLTELEFVIKSIKDEGWLKGRVGLEKMSHRPNPLVAAMFDEALAREGCEVVNASEIVRQVRAIKSPQELTYHKIAGKLADIGMKAAVDAIRPGVTEMEVRAEALYAMTKAGSEDTGIPMPILAGPQRTAMVHALTSQKVIMPGDMILFDCCGVYKRYHTNTSKVISCGEPHPKVLEQLEKISGALKLFKETIRPNLSAKELSKTMREYYKEVGIWDDRRWLGGYEIGPAFAPSWIGSWVYNIGETDEDERIFLPGNVMNHEAQFYLPKASGSAIVIETVAIEDEDASILTETEGSYIIADNF